ncbi:MAG: hypothetical protein ACLFWB_13885, partial [Armatimonadota bacterium]
MKPQLMRYIDNTLGVALCAVLYVWRRVTSLLSGSQAHHPPPERILVIKTMGLGTVLETSSMIKA